MAVRTFKWHARTEPLNRVAYDVGVRIRRNPIDVQVDSLNYQSYFCGATFFSFKYKIRHACLEQVERCSFSHKVLEAH